MSALAPDALAGLSVACAGTEAGDDSATDAGGGTAGIPDRGAGSSLARALGKFGARLTDGDEPVDLLVVTLNGGAPTLDAAADGEVAAAVTAAFSAARDGASRLRPGGCLLFVLANAATEHADDDPARAAVASLTRTLALEWAPERRVNALICGAPENAAEATALIAWRASRTLTGALLDLTG